MRTWCTVQSIMLLTFNLKQRNRNNHLQATPLLPASPVAQWLAAPPIVGTPPRFVASGWPVRLPAADAPLQPGTAASS